MYYEKSLPLRCDEGAALELAFATFAGCGLMVTGRNGSAVEAAGPYRGGRAGRGGGGSMIGAASRAEVRVGGGWVTVRAEFAGLRRLPLILGIVMGVLALAILGVAMGLAALGVLSGFGVVLALLPLVPIVAVSVLLLSHFRRRAAAELDVFLNNLTMAGPQGTGVSAAWG